MTKNVKMFIALNESQVLKVIYFALWINFHALTQILQKMSNIYNNQKISFLKSRNQKQKQSCLNGDFQQR